MVDFDPYDLKRPEIRSHDPQSPPMPETTKKETKRRKRRTKSNSGPISQGNLIGQIYQDVTERTLAKIADEMTEKRLSKHGPSTSVRNGGMQFIW